MSADHGEVDSNGADYGGADYGGAGLAARTTAARVWALVATPGMGQQVQSARQAKTAQQARHPSGPQPLRARKHPR